MSPQLNMKTIPFYSLFLGLSLLTLSEVGERLCSNNARAGAKLTIRANLEGGGAGNGDLFAPHALYTRL